MELPNLYHPGPKRYKGLRIKTWFTLTILLLVAAIPSAVGYQTRQYEKSLTKLEKAIQLQAYTQHRDYTKPELAPLPEREANTALIRRVWGRDAEIGIAIARAESGLRTKASHINRNGTIDEGVFQVNSVHGMPDMLGAVSNISYAYTIYLKQGTSPWISSKSNWSAYLANK